MSRPRAQRGRVGLPVSVCLHPFVRVCVGIKVHLQQLLSSLCVPVAGLTLPSL